MHTGERFKFFHQLATFTEFRYSRIVKRRSTQKNPRRSTVRRSMPNSDFSDSLAGVSLKWRTGKRAPGEPRKRPPLVKGLVGWMLRRFAKDKAAREALFAKVSGQLFSSAERLTYANEPPEPVLVKRGRGKRVAEAPTVPHVVVPVTPARVLAHTLTALAANNGDVFDVQEPDGFNEALEDLLQEKFGLDFQRMHYRLRDGNLKLNARPIGVEITDPEVEVPHYDDIADIRLRDGLKRMGGTDVSARWRFESIDDGSAWVHWPQYITYDVEADFPFNASAAVLAMFGREALLREAAKAIREVQS